jgi:thiol-disulfide isomerase/thioredoxin
MKRLMLILFFSLSFLTLINAQTVISGKLLGADGKPMIKECVVLKKSFGNDVIKAGNTDESGNYSITVDSSGLWMLVFSGVYHQAVQMALYTDRPEKMEVDVNLQTYNYVKDFSHLEVTGDFNNWDPQKAVPLEKQPDGTYSAEINAPSDTVIYRIEFAVSNDLVEGTEPCGFVYNGYHGYNSIAAGSQGKVKIQFDPSKLIELPQKEEVTFKDSNSFISKFSEIYLEMKRNEFYFMKKYGEYRASGKDMKNFKYDCQPEVEKLAGMIKNEKDSILKQELLLSYISLSSYRAELDSTIALEALNKISPSSKIWTLNPYLITSALRLAHVTGNKYDAYTQGVIDTYPDNQIKAYLLFDKFMRAKLTHKDSLAANYFDLLTNKYGDTQYGEMVKQRFSPTDNFRVGSHVPHFSVVSMDDSTKIITDKTMQGKYYLIDFWATWCGPCVAEMGNLQKVYEKFKDKGFIILSISMDNTPQAVEKFRSEKWKMPWLNAYLGIDSKNPIFKKFEVIGIPHPILVNKSGTMVAIDSGLRGDELEKTIAKYLH